MPDDDTLAKAEADNYRRAIEGHRAPDAEQPPVAAGTDEETEAE